MIPQNHHSQDESAMEKGRLVFRWSLIVTAGFALLVMLGLILANQLYGIEAIERFTDHAKPWLTLWRAALFIALIGGWRYWSLLYAAWSGMSDHQFQRLLRYRWRIALWLLVMEAVFSQGVLFEFINHLMEEPVL